MERDADLVINELARARHGVVTHAEAVDAGLSQRQICHRVDQQRWQRLARGLFLVGAMAPTNRALLAAATLAVPGAAASHESAAELWGMSFVPRDRTVITVPNGSNHRSQLALVHQSLWLPDTDIVILDGIRWTARARTILELSAVVGWQRFARVLDDQLNTHAIDLPTLYRSFYRYTRRGRRRTARVRLLLEVRGPGFVAPETELEARYLDLVERYGLGEPERQVRFDWREDLPGRVDFVYRRVRAIVEVDGRRWHGRDEDFEHDRIRDNEAQLAGWHPYRFTWKHVTQNPEYVVRTVRRLLAA